MKWIAPIFLAIAVSVECRDPKWFLSQRTITSVVYQNKMVTELSPSSCVVVEPSLTPCRNLRHINVISPSKTSRMDMTAGPGLGMPRAEGATPPLSGSHEEVPHHQGGFGSWLSNWSWGGVTKTHVMYRDETVRAVDPNTVITFSVRGCRPSRLPFNLPLCSSSTPPSTSSLSSATVSTSVVSATTPAPEPSPTSTEVSSSTSSSPTPALDPTPSAKQTPQTLSRELHFTNIDTQP